MAKVQALTVLLCEIVQSVPSEPQLVDEVRPLHLATSPPLHIALSSFPLPFSCRRLAHLHTCAQLQALVRSSSNAKVCSARCRRARMPTARARAGGGEEGRHGGGAEADGGGGTACAGGWVWVARPVGGC